MLRGNKDRIVTEFYLVARASVKKAYEGDGTVLWDAPFSSKLSAQVSALALSIAAKLSESVIDDGNDATYGKLAQGAVKDACKEASAWFSKVSAGGASKERSSAFERNFTFEIKRLLTRLVTVEEKPKRKSTKRKKSDDNGSST